MRRRAGSARQAQRGCGQQRGELHTQQLVGVRRGGVLRTGHTHLRRAVAIYGEVGGREEQLGGGSGEGTEGKGGMAASTAAGSGAGRHRGAERQNNSTGNNKKARTANGKQKQD
ncbi:hypothetical protein NDU88_003369 [Pleurodeles waltl]|uniref:Uncharacterized protein n=1 Tax=Pleurodeles waltl TaxID=8319 RepID=A0AAV7M8L5_PLEWA|nr:hypothetical protein NDU88_003369 [Pleurodeles waltl]